VAPRQLAPHTARHVCLGLGERNTAIRMQKGERAILGQEMRNPRAGRFTFTVEACLCGSSQVMCELFAKQFTCRLVLYRFADADKNPLKRHELASLTIQPRAIVGNRPAWSGFELRQLLDSAGPGRNFSVGRGLGVAIEVEKTLDGSLEMGPDARTNGPGGASLRIRSAQLRFTGRTINDKVMV
jgi:hypothetical protein